MKDPQNTESNLLSIGLIAKSMGVSTNSIRRMEAAGLFSPAYVSPESKYRYYDPDIIARIYLIMYLKSFGFTYNDIRTAIEARGDYSSLLDILTAQRDALNLKIERLESIVKGNVLKEIKIDFCSEVCFLTKTVSMVPTLENISSVSREFLFDSIKEATPLDYTRPLLLLVDNSDYKTYQWNIEQDITFCLPLRQKTAQEGCLLLPAVKVLSLTWDYSNHDYQNFIPLIDLLLDLNDVKQAGALRASYDIGGYMGADILPEHMIFHIMVPIE